MPYLTRDQIQAARDLPTREVPCPEWGGVVLVRGLTGAERDAFEESLWAGAGKGRHVALANIRAKLAALCVIDKDGQPVFSETDVAWLGQKSAAPLDRIYDAVTALSGIGEDDLKALEGNSGSGQSAASGSG